MTDGYPWREELEEYVGASAADSTLLEQCSDTAQALVSAYIGEHEIPTPILHRAAMEVAAELFHRRNAPGGIRQAPTLEGSAPVRMARDPMLAAYPLLDRFLPKGIA